MPTPTEQFTANPYGFAKKHGIMAPGEQGDLNQYKTKAMLDGSDTFYQVAGGRRIQWLTLSLFQNGAYLANLATRPQAGHVPVYYLPWNKNQIVRMTLRHSKKADEHLLGSNNQPVEPAIFLTAAVNGCSVFVEGPPDQPTVYHANAAGAPDAPTLDEGDSWTIATRIRDKTTEMRERYQSFSSGFVKGGRTGGPGNYGPGALPGQEARETNMRDYLLIPGTELHANDERELLREVARRKGIKSRPKVGNINPGEVKISDFVGTIFGAKDAGTGNWRFYYQKLVQVEYYQKKHFYSKSSQENSWIFKCRMKTLTCQQFWPEGAGHVVERY